MKNPLNLRVLVIILAVAVFVLTAHIGIGAYNGYMVKTISDSYVAGYNDGMVATIGQLVSQSAACSPVPVYFGNTTMNLIDISCLEG